MSVWVGMNAHVVTHVFGRVFTWARVALSLRAVRRLRQASVTPAVGRAVSRRAGPVALM